MDTATEYSNRFAAKMARWLAPDAAETTTSDPEKPPGLPADVPVPSPTPAVDPQLVEAAEIRLALSGRISPNLLTNSSLSDELRANVLNQLVGNCVVEAGETSVNWLMKQPRRVAVLQNLIDAGTLTTQLARTLPATDQFGHSLRRLLASGGESALAASQLPDERLALMEAMEATKPLNLPQPDWTQVRREIGLDNFLQDQRLLLANGFVGRRTELATLREFVTRPAPAGTSLWQGLVVSGLGGSGKSTLLAKFAEEVVRDNLATLIVFDFDRPGLNPDDQLWLESEMARQVGYQYPAITEWLRQQRADVRRQKATLGDNIASESESVSDERSLSLLPAIRSGLAQAGADARPLLLLLDTFEEVDQQNLTDKLLHWLRNLSERFSGTPVRVIFSGRLFDDALEAVLKACSRRQLELGELSVGETKSLLKRLSVPDDLARRVAESAQIPHRPLELKLLAQMLTERGESTLQEIEAELRSGGEAAKLLFTGLVYRRVLLRITDPIARQLAYPGLVLRYVTVELIQRVLAPVLKLKLSKAAATAALEALARHSWICYRGSNGEIWHRKDLRRSMLGAMRAQEPTLTRAISEAAFAYFSRKDKKLTNKQLQAEQTYHRLLWLQQPDEGAACDLPTLKNAADVIGADVVDLPKTAAVLLEYAQKGRVSANDVEYLPAEYVQKAYQKTGERLMNNREFGKALRLYERGQQVGRTYQETGVHQAWELEMLFATAKWDTLEQALAHGNLIGESDTTDSLKDDSLYYRLLLSGVSVSDSSLYTESVGRFRMVSFTEKPSKQAIAVLKKTVIQWLLINDSKSFRWTTSQLVIIRSYARLLISFQDEYQSAHLQRKLLYIDLITENKLADKITLAPSLLKIDPGWLAGLVTQPFIKKQEGEAGKALRQLLLDARALLTRKTVRRTLDALDVLYKNKQDWQVRGNIGTSVRDGQELMRWFRGPDPEFRDPVRFALLDAFQTRDDYRELAGLLASVLALPFTDLEPDAFAEAMVPDPEHFLEPYIELADRSWALGTLLEKVVAARPQAAPLARVRAAYDRWDAAVTAAFMAYSPVN